MTKVTEVNHALEQALAQLASIREMVAAMDDGSGGENGARERIEQDALSVEVRSDWYAPGQSLDKPTEYRILLCTGGPACRIIGELNQHCEPETAVLQYQDWGTPWTVLSLDDENQDAVLTYARVFYFGE